MLPVKLIVASLLLFTLCAKAQNGHYWFPDYGPGGFLTPGAVIANNRDSGVLFYNPALLANVLENSASVSGNVYQYGAIDIKNGIGAGLDLKSVNTSIVPLMAANVLHLKLKKPFTIGYALINTPMLNYLVTQRKDAKFNVLNDSYSPGPEYFLGQYTAQNSINETSLILSAGYKVSSRLSLGLTAEGQIHKQTYSETYSARALINTATDTLDPPIVNSQEYYLLTYTHYGVRFKGGLAYDITDRQHIGLLVSSPLLHLGGTATLTSDNVINNLQIDSAYNLYLLASTRQTGLKPKWKLPLSIALGYTYEYDKGEIYVSAETFLKVKDYNVITPQNSYFIRPDTANNSATSALLKMEDARKAITNVSVGITYRIKPTVTAYFSMRTDFNYIDNALLKDQESYTSNTADWNEYHWQLGANFKKRKFNLRVGILITYGATNKYLQPVNFDDPNESNYLLGDPHATHASQFSAGLMLAYIHNF